MSEIISRELLSEVLNITVHSLNEELGDINYEYSKKEAGYSKEDSVNIHELAHKCKEWAWDKGHSLCTTPLMAKPSIIYCWDELQSSSNETISIKADSEPEAIFKACEYILKEAKND